MYTRDYLLEKLNELFIKYGEIKTKFIDKEPNFPTRKCFVREFGSIKNACELIGYTEYSNKTFNIYDAQRILDERNGHFDLLTFNGMRNKASIRCRECGTVDNISPDSLLRNKTDKYFGCKSCNKKLCKSNIAIQIIEDNPMQYSIKVLQEKYPEREGYGYVYEVLNLVNQKKYIGSTKSPFKRWIEHLRAAFTEDNPSYNYPLQSAIRKYTVDKFVFHVLYTNIPNEQLSDKERDTIIERNTLSNIGWGYNQTLETSCALRDNFESKSKRCKCALVDSDDNIVEIFDSYHSASRNVFGDKNKASHIRQVCKGDRNTVCGRIFRDLDENNLVVNITKNKNF